MGTQTQIDKSNQIFWDELCGTGLAVSLGITEHNPHSLKQFDDAYMDIYPYLADYLHAETLAGKQVLEVGLGYGTLGQKLIEHGAHYHGVDIAPAPVHMMKYRCALLSSSAANRILQGSTLQLPYADHSFDIIYSIGVLHHTGNLHRAVEEIYRTLKPGGHTVIMLYSNQSFVYYRRLLASFLSQIRSNLRKGNHPSINERLRATYDASTAENTAAPHTVFVSRRDIREMFRAFTSVKIDVQNFENLVIPLVRIVIPREIWLRNIARIAGSDFYITAIR